MRTSRFLIPIIVLLFTLATACGGSNTVAKQVAEPVAPVTLRIGTNDPDDAPTAAAIEEFARQVDDGSGGTMHVEPVWRAAGDPPPDDWDQAVARMVARGELDMGLIPSAAWDSEGVTSLRALNAPFLVDSDALVGSIVTSDIAGDLMAGLDHVGVTGLALLPEGLRHVFAFGAPLLSPSDFTGAKIRAPHSDTVYAVFQALGATVDDPNGSDFDAAVGAGELAAAESSFQRASSLPGGHLTATGNLTLFPKVNSLVVNNHTLGALSDAQRAMLRDAAERTRAYVVTNTTGDAKDAQAYCTANGSVVLASDGDLAAFTEAVQPVYDALQKDAATKDLIGRIREVKAKTASAPAAAACDSSAAAPTTVTPSANGSATIPLGRYAKVGTRAAYIERGLDPNVVDEMLGPDGEIVVVLEIADGRWTEYERLADGTEELGDLGSYSYDSAGHWVTEGASGGCRGCRAAFDWALVDGVLSLTLAPIDGYSDYPDDVHVITEGDFEREQ
ncbi:MAG: TRAP transporter substrate-binding protein DctP [Acidimicrobiales bacterium]